MPSRFFSRALALAFCLLAAVCGSALVSAPTISGNVFATTPVGIPEKQTVTLTLISPEAITSIVLQSAGAGDSEYVIGAITGCTVDGTTVNAPGTVCSIPVTFTPASPGSTASGALSRNATLVFTDPNSASVFVYGLSGAATASVAHLVPGTMTDFAGLPYTAAGPPPVSPLDNGLGLVNQAYGGDGGPATSAQFNFYAATGFPVGPNAAAQPLALDSAGNMYVVDSGNYIIRKIDNTASHIVTTIAGTPGKSAYAGDGGAATSATLTTPHGITLDSAGNVYFLDVNGTGNGMVRRVDAITGTITAVAGQNYHAVDGYNSAGGGVCHPDLGQPGYWECGDGGLATYADIPQAGNLAIDAAGNLYIWELTGAYIRKITTSTGIITTVATAADFSTTSGTYGGMTLASDGNLYVVVIDQTSGQGVIKEFNTTSNAVSILAGGGTNSGNYCALTTAQAGYPATNVFIGTNIVPTSGDLSSDASGNIYLNAELCQTDGYTYGQPAIWRVNLASGYAYLEALGNVQGSGTATSNYNAFYSYYVLPYSAIPDNAGNLYFITYNQVAELSGTNAALNFVERYDFTTSAPQFATYANVGNATEASPPYALDSGVNFTVAPAGDASACNVISSVSAGATCSLDIDFSPTLVGALSDTLAVNGATPAKAKGKDQVHPDAGPGGSGQTVALSGIGLAAPQISYIPPSIAFGNQTVNVASAPQTVTVSNPGTGPLSFFGFSISTTTPTNQSYLDFQVVTGAGAGTCPSSGQLAAGSSCTILVTFTPLALASYSANVTINNTATTNPSDGSLVATALTGTGVPAVLPPTATPVITPAAGTYNASVAVQITDATANSTIDYSTDGTAPSIAYSAPFTVTKTGTQVQAIATATGDSASTIASSTYTVQPYLLFNPAAVGITHGSAQQLTAAFSLVGSTTPTATLHYGHDYTVGSVSCTPNGSIELCTVPVTFVPTLPGARKDALFLANGTTRIATVLLDGTGQAPFALLQPGVDTASVPAYTIGGSVVDENGTAYVLVANTASAVTSITKGGVVTALPIPAVAANGSITIDGAGVLYILGAGSANFVTYDTVQGTLGTSALPGIPSVDVWDTGSVGNTGNTYAAYINAFALPTSSDPDYFYTVKPDGTSTSVALPLAFQSGGNFYAMTVDSAENVFLGGGPLLYEITPAGVVTQISNGGISRGLAVDAADTVYQPYAGLLGVEELPASDYTTPVSAISPVDVNNPGTPIGIDGVSVGSDGTVFISSNANHLDTVDRSQGATAFGQQNATTTSAPQNVDVYNGGNMPLTLSSFVLTGSAFAIQTAALKPCTIGIVIAPGDLCHVPVIFTPPHAGSFTGAVTFTTNSLSSAGTTVTDVLTGYSLGAYFVESPNPLNFSPQAVNTTSGPLQATLTNQGYGAAQFGNPVSANSVFSVGIGTCNTNIPVNGTCQLSVTFSPTAPVAATGLVTVGAGSVDGGPGLTLSFTVNGTGTNSGPAAQTITFPNPGTQTYGVAPITLTAAASSGLAVSYAVTAGPATVSGKTLTITGAGSVTVQATQAGNANFAAATPVSVTFTVNPAAQTITFPNPGTQTYGVAPITLTATASSGLAVSYAVTTGPATVSGKTLTITGAGSVTVQAAQAGNANFATAAAVSVTFTVNPEAQTITFPNPGTQTYGVAPITLTATATSGLTVSYTVTSGPATVSGSTLTITGAGSVTVQATQAGNANFAAATPVSVTFTVNAPATPDFTVSASPASQSVSPGGAASYTVTVRSVNGNFAGVVGLTASGLPSGATASFSPANVSPGDGSATSTLTVQTAAATAMAKARILGWTLATPALGLILLLPVGRQRKQRVRKLLITLAILTSVVSAALMMGCGGGFALGKQSTSYTLTITGTSGNDTHATTVQLTVQ